MTKGATDVFVKYYHYEGLRSYLVKRGMDMDNDWIGVWACDVIDEYINQHQTDKHGV